jgi:hypothetical protein
MAVAKSYEHMKVIAGPYAGTSGKQYVRLSDSCSRCGGSGIWHYGPYGGTCFKCNGSGREVIEARWYSDKERAAMDAQAEARAEKARQAKEMEELRRAGAEYNGFQNGYVIVIYGETYSVKDELKSAGARFNYGLGWYFSNEADVPSKFVEQSLRITWEMVSRENKIMSDIDIKEIVKNAIPKPISNSDYMGEVGKRIRGLELEVVKFWEGPGYYIHTMEDTFGNVYVWMTSARALEKGTVVRLDATVKKHEEYQGVKQTHLTRPSIKEVMPV